MIKETVQAVGTTHVVTETGSKTLLGNRQFEIGESVWTDGNFAFGTERNNPAPLIIPTGATPAVPGYYFVEFTSGKLRIREASGSYTVVAEIPIPSDMSSSDWFAYDPESLKFSGLQYISYNTLKIHTVQNGQYTVQDITLPYATSDRSFVKTGSGMYCEYVNGKLFWSVCCDDFFYNRYMARDGTIVNNNSGHIAIFDYEDTTLVKITDYTDKVIAQHDATWDDAMALFIDDDLITISITNKGTEAYQPQAGQETTEREFKILREKISIELSDNCNTQIYDTSSVYAPQYPNAMQTGGNSTTVRSIKDKLLKFDARVYCCLFLYAENTVGNIVDSMKQATLNGKTVEVLKYPFGRILTTRIFSIDGDGNVIMGMNMIRGIANIDDYNLTTNYTNNNWTKIDVSSNIKYKCDITFAYNGIDVLTGPGFNITTSQKIGSGYTLDIHYIYTITFNTMTFHFPGYNTSIDETSVLNDGNGWTLALEYYDDNYFDFLFVDTDGNLVYYNSWWILYKIVKSTKAITEIHEDFLEQCSMPMIEGFKDAIVASLTTT